MNDEGEAQKQIAILLHELRQPLHAIMLSCRNIQNCVKMDNGNLEEFYLTKKMDFIILAIQKSSIIIEKIESISHHN